MVNVSGVSFLAGLCSTVDVPAQLDEEDEGFFALEEAAVDGTEEAGDYDAFHITQPQHTKSYTPGF